MKKLLSLSTFLLLLFVVNVHGATGSSNEDQMKWGVVLKPHFSGVNLPILPSTLDNVTFAPSIEFFDEIKLSSTVGLRFSTTYAFWRGGKLVMGGKENLSSTIVRIASSIATGMADQMPDQELADWVRNLNSAQTLETKASLHTTEIDFAIVPRFYLGENKKLGIYVGPVLNYVWSAKLKYSAVHKDKAFLSGEVDLLDKRNSKDHRMPRVGWGIVMGLDYEFNSGVALGCAYNVGLSNIIPQALKPISAKKFSGGLTLGFNLAKLL